MQLGFAQSTCTYDDYPDTLPIPGFPNNLPTISKCLLYSECTAVCIPQTSNDGFIAVGVQSVQDTCASKTTKNDCHVPCDHYGKVIRGNPVCPDTPWSECSSTCTQYRSYTTSSTSCKITKETRSCYSGSCPVLEGDYIVLLDMRVPISPKTWSYVYSDIFILALEEIFAVRKTTSLH
jgi:hypothetical protein